MALFTEASCPWPVDHDACEVLGLNIEPDDPIFLKAVGTASSIMTRLSAYTVGICEAQIRPLNMCRECRTWCCGGADSLYLNGPFSIPVREVTTVRLGATEYDPKTWHFDPEMQMLYRVPPEVWPKRDEKWSAPGQGEAFVVDALVGSRPDDWANDVLVRLVKELVLSCTGGKCRLPSNVTTVTGQGITVRLRDNEVNTFIPELGAWTNSVNPHGARIPAAVFSPDIAPSRRGSHGGLAGCCA